jgi:hypothetical protein
MPQFEYTCLTREGRRVRGNQEAADKKELSARMWQQGLFLVSCRELREGTSDESVPTAPITEDEVRVDLAPAAESDRWVSDAASPARWPLISPLRVLLWIADHSHGAVTNTRQALLVLAVAGGFLTSAVYFAWHGLEFSSFRKRTMMLPPVAQPALSLDVVNGQRRQVKTCLFTQAPAPLIKMALDHVMRRSTLTSHFTSSKGNALMVKATPPDLQLIEQLLPGIDRNYGDLPEEAIVMSMINTMSLARAKWMSVSHPVPEPTADNSTR